MRKNKTNHMVRLTPKMEIVPAETPAPLVSRSRPKISIERMMADWMGGKSPATVRSYTDSMISFKEFCRTDTEGQALEHLFSLSHGEANMVALEYKNWMHAAGHAPGSINTRLAALRSVVALAHLIGRVPWEISVRNEKNEVLKDTRGPGADGFEKLLKAAREQKNEKKAVRDVALLGVLYLQVLRREGAASLDMEHVDLENGKLSVMLKGQRQRTIFTISPELIDSLKAWIKVRGDDAGPLFTSMDRAKKGSGRMSGNGIWATIKGLGEACGLKTWPHALRHAGTTTALDETDGNVRAVQRFTGHKSIAMVVRYDDNREDLGGEVARKVGRRHKK